MESSETPVLHRGRTVPKGLPTSTFKFNRFLCTTLSKHVTYIVCYTFICK